jgi:hypothetical protein
MSRLADISACVQPGARMTTEERALGLAAGPPLHQSRAAERAGEFGWPMGLRREYAAAYCGISTSKFDDWVARGLVPAGKRQDKVVLWVRRQLDLALESLPDDGHEGKANPFRDLAT